MTICPRSPNGRGAALKMLIVRVRIPPGVLRRRTFVIKETQQIIGGIEEASGRQISVEVRRDSIRITESAGRILTSQVFRDADVALTWLQRELEIELSTSANRG